MLKSLVSAESKRCSMTLGSLLEDGESSNAGDTSFNSACRFMACSKFSRRALKRIYAYAFYHSVQARHSSLAVPWFDHRQTSLLVLLRALSPFPAQLTAMPKPIGCRRHACRPLAPQAAQGMDWTLPIRKRSSRATRVVEAASIPHFWSSRSLC